MAQTFHKSIHGSHYAIVSTLETGLVIDPLIRSTGSGCLVHKQFWPLPFALQQCALYNQSHRQAKRQPLVSDSTVYSLGGVYIDAARLTEDFETFRSHG